MIYSPKYIIYWAVSNYISEEEELTIRNELIEYKRLSDRNLLKVMQRHFDFKKMMDTPFIDEDIWIYNYITYDFKGSRLPRKGLIADYERKVVIKVKNVVFDMLHAI
jgi:hypothetical protein